MSKITISKAERRIIIILMIINSFALFVNTFEYNSYTTRGISYAGYTEKRYYFLTDKGRRDSRFESRNNNKNAKDIFFPFTNFTDENIIHSTTDSFGNTSTNTTVNKYWKFRGIFPDYDYIEFGVYSILIFGVVLIRKIW